MNDLGEGSSTRGGRSHTIEAEVVALNPPHEGREAPVTIVDRLASPLSAPTRTARHDE